MADLFASLARHAGAGAGATAGPEDLKVTANRSVLGGAGSGEPGKLVPKQAPMVGTTLLVGRRAPAAGQPQ